MPWQFQRLWPQFLRAWRAGEEFLSALPLEFLWSDGITITVDPIWAPDEVGLAVRSTLHWMSGEMDNKANMLPHGKAKWSGEDEGREREADCSHQSLSIVLWCGAGWSWSFNDFSRLATSYRPLRTVWPPVILALKNSKVWTWGMKDT
jgi:hypothetical protein